MTWLNGRCLMMISMAALLAGAIPNNGAAHAQTRDDYREAKWNRHRPHHEWHHDWKDKNKEKKQRNDARAEGVVTGVVAAAVIGGVVAAIASDNREKKKRRARSDYCIDRYGNYDERTDSYHDRDGVWYRCE